MAECGSAVFVEAGRFSRKAFFAKERDVDILARRLPRVADDSLDSGLELSWIWRWEWRDSHTRADYEGTWQREVITYLEYKYLVLCQRYVP